MSTWLPWFFVCVAYWAGPCLWCAWQQDDDLSGCLGRTSLFGAGVGGVIWVLAAIAGWPRLASLGEVLTFAPLVALIVGLCWLPAAYARLVTSRR